MMVRVHPPHKVRTARILCVLGLHRWVDLGGGIRFCPRCGARRWRAVLRAGEKAEIPARRTLR